LSAAPIEAVRAYPSNGAIAENLSHIVVLTKATAGAYTLPRRLGAALC
jgi:hypothetical protein